MDISQEFKCSQCLENFTTSNLPLKMIYCSHNICQNCFTQVQESAQDIVQCQFCGSTILQCQNKKLEINKALIVKIISPKKKEQAIIDTSSSFNNVSLKMEKNLMPAEDNQILLMEDEGLISKKSVGKNNVTQPKFNVQMCAIHEKPLQIICLTDLKRICPHCAIFGNHRDHKFKSLKEFEDDFNENLLNFQLIKQRKYKIDKKIKTWEYNDGIMKKIRFKQDDLKKSIENKFDRLISNIKNFEKKVLDDMTDSFSQVEKKINGMLMDDSKTENQFMNWELQHENNLNQVHKNIPINEKITIMYGPLVDLKEGQKLITQMEKRIEVVNLKIDEEIDTIKFDFNDNINLSSLAKVYISDEKKESFISAIQKVHSPMSKHLIDEIGDFTDNSFICDYSRQQLSAFIESPKQKTPVKKKPRISGNTSEVKLKTPQMQSPKNRMTRCKSNNNLNLPSFESTRERRKSTTRQEPTQHRNPQEVMVDFLANDLKDVLDLSQCQLTNDQAYEYLKDIRRHRKIRGLKLNKNFINDEGFLKMINLFSTTSNLNLAGNQLTEACLGLILKNRQKFSPLRIVNLSGNRFDERKAKIKIDQLRKLRIIVTL